MTYSVSRVLKVKIPNREASNQILAMVILGSGTNLRPFKKKECLLWKSIRV